MRNYPLNVAVEILLTYIYAMTGQKIALAIDFNNPKDVELFEKASNFALNWWENN